MFQKLSLIILLSFLLSNIAQAQVVPDGIIFQAVAKDRNGNAANGRTIYAVVSILANQNMDSKVYTERFVLLSSADGVFTLVIGKGSRLSGAASLTDIPWDKSYYLNVKIAIAPSIENTVWQEEKEYLDLGISQFWSVPYAFYSSNSLSTESAKTLSSTLSSNKGGTGVDNKGKTFTYQNNMAVLGTGDLTITTTKASNITFPSTGTLSTLTGAEVLTNKTLESPRLTGLATTITPNIDSRDSTIATTLFVDSLLTIQLAQTASSLTDSLIKSILKIDSTLLTKMNYTDSAAMLNDYLAALNNLRATKLNALDTANLSNWKLNKSDTAAMLSNYLAALNNLRGTKLNVTDTSAMLSNYLAALNNLRGTKLNAADTLNLSQWKLNAADTILLSKRIDLKLDTSDFHLMITPYLTKMNGVSYADTSALLSNYLAALNNLRATKLNATDTVAMLSNYLAALNNLRSTKLNAVDTINLSLWKLNAADTANLAKYKLNAADTANLAIWKLNKSDTSAMLSNYLAALNNLRDTKLNAADTANLATWKLNKSDTSAMLSNYLAALNNLRSTKLNSVDTANLSLWKLNAADTANLAKYKLNAADTILLSKRIDLKLDTTDFHLMIAPYLKKMNGVSYADTTALLANYLTGIIALNSDTATLQDRLNLRLAKGDTATMLTPYLAALNDLRATKINASDTAAMLSNYLAALNNLRSTKLNAVDTANLAKYKLNAADTANLATWKLNKSDTTSMLSNYLAALNNLRSTKLNSIDTTNLSIWKLNAVDTASLAKWKLNKVDTAFLLQKRDTITLSNRIDALSYSNGVVSAGSLKLSDTTAMLSNYLASLNNLRSSKLNAIDTANLSLWKLNKVDTAFLLQKRDTITLSNRIDALSYSNGVVSAAALKLSDTAAMLTNYLAALNNLRSTKLNSIDTANLSMWKLNAADTANLSKWKLNASDTIKLATWKLNKADTAAMLTNYLAALNILRSTKLNSVDTANLSMWKLNAADTANLAKYKLNAADTASLAKWKLNKSDTVAMLSNYLAALNNLRSTKLNALDTANLSLWKLNAADTANLANWKLNKADTALMLAPYLNEVVDLRLKKFNLSDTSYLLQKRDTITLSNRIDALSLSSGIISAEKLKISDTAVMLRHYLSEVIDLRDSKVNNRDTSAMLNPYLNTLIASAKYSDTSLMLRNYLTEIIQLGISKLNKTDTNVMLRPYLNSVMNSVKYSDTSNLLNNYLASLNDLRSTKVNYTDTAAILTNYLAALNNLRSTKLNATDTAKLSTWKLNKADTTLMLSNYLAALNNLRGTKLNASDTATMLTRYLSNIIDLQVNKLNASDTALMLDNYRNRLNLLMDVNATLNANFNSKENVSNKSTNVVTDAGSDIKYPSVRAIKNYVDDEILANGTPEATSLIKGKLQLSGDLGGTASAPTVTNVGGSSAAQINTATLLANGATSGNTPNTIVKRDASGNFNAGTITATLSGNATNVSGIVAGANGGTGINNNGKTITLGGNITTQGNFSLSGANALTFNTTNTTNLYLPTTGTLATLMGTENLINKTINGVTPSSQASGFTLVGGTSAKTLNVNNDATLSGTNTGDQTITLTGDVTGSGLGIFAATLASSGVTPGIYGAATQTPVFTVDAKGRLTNVSNTTISGVSTIGSRLESGKIIVGDYNDQASKVSMDGDVTINNLGITTISNDAITDIKIKAGTINYNKIQNVSGPDKILGRISAGAGSIEEISTIGTGNVVREGSPSFSGNPTVPTASLISNNLTIANTEFVTRAVSNVNVSNITGVLPGANGGTGVNNTGKTLTLGGNFITQGASTIKFRTSGATDLNLPTSGTLATLSDITNGAIGGGQITGVIAPLNGGTGIANDNSKTITLGGAFVTDGAFSTTLRSTANTDITLPNTGTLVTLAGGETLTNKTISAADNTIQNITNANISATAGIKDTKLDNITTAGKVANTATTATSSNTLNTIVARDANGDFSARIVTGSLNGNASTATKLANVNSIYGNDFDGSANLTQVISAQYGGTGNAYVKFLGASSTIKNYTLPDADATILTTNTQVTTAQGGTGVSTAAANLVFAGPVSGTATAPSFRALVASDLPSGSSQYINNSTLVQSAANFNISGSGVLGGTVTASAFGIPGGMSNQFLKADGSIDANTYATIMGAESLTNKTINGLSLTPLSTGFSIAGGTSSKTLNVLDATSISGTNTGDINLSGENYLSLSNQSLTVNPIDLSSTNASGTLAAARFPGLLGDVTNSVGSLSTTIANAAITTNKITNKAVNFSKIQDISLQTLLGNSSATGAGSIHEIKIGSGLTLNPIDQTLSASGTGGTVTGVTGTAPIISSGGNAPAISITQATTSTNGYLTSADWNLFNGKQAAGNYLSGTVSIANGGTGATDVITARTNLGLAIGTNVLAQRSFGTAANSAVEDFSPVTGSTSLTTLGTITTGVWNATKIDDGYITSASTWNAKESPLTFTAPLSRSTNSISIPVATTNTSGYLSTTDWNTFNTKQAPINLTTIGTSGVATFSDNTLNIPQYTGGGTVTSVAALTLSSSGSDISSTIVNGTTTPVITLNVPDASASARGVVSTSAQTFAGAKTFSGSSTFSGPILFSGASTYSNTSSFAVAPTFSTMTAGSVLFAGTSGALSQSNSNLFWDNTNSRLGIGSASPSNILYVNSRDYNNAFFDANTDNLVTISSRSYNARSALLFSGNGGWNGYAIIQSGNSQTLNFNRSSNLNTNASTMLLDGAGQVGIGTISPTARLHVVGTSKLDGQASMIGSVTATSGLAQGIIITPTLTAASNSDLLIGMDINPTFTTGVYSATTNTIGLRVQGMTIGIGNGGISSNTVVGFGSLSKNLYGGSNTAVGYNAMSKVTGEFGSGSKGWWNTAVGSNALYSNVLSAFNTAVGSGALFANIANSNTAVGTNALTSNTTGADNTSVGTNSLIGLSSGSNNIGIGSASGRFISGGVTGLTSASNSIFIGTNAFPLADAQTNQIVIGFGAVGLGSNSTVIGNSSTTNAQIFGTLQTQGNKLAIAAKTAAYTINATDQIITGDASSASFTVSLPTAIARDGQTFTIKKIDNSANTVTVGTTSSQTIDGNITYTLSARYKYVTVVSDGGNWMIVGGN